jgi:glutaredoxin
MPAPYSPLILYSTPACHLCETAHALMAPHLERLGIVLEEVDISSSDALVDRYGIRIPVIRFADGEAELGWPFNEEAFLGFVGGDSG